MPRKVFTAGEILTAADVNTNLMDQSVMVFDDATARTTAIPTPVEGMVTYLKDTDEVDKFDGSSFVPVASSSGFTASTTIIATNSNFSVPNLGSPIVKVTAIGGGGGAGGNSNGGNGATTTFNAGAAGTISAAGGLGGTIRNQTYTGKTGTIGFASGNAGTAGSVNSDGSQTGQDGTGGRTTVGYLDLTGITTVNVTIGAGGSATLGGPGGRGEVIFEFVAA